MVILEYCEGNSLIGHLMANQVLPESIARTFFRQMMTALFHLHSFNVVHRDLKPDNILVDADANIKIADFGMSGAVEDLDEMNFSTCCGTESYMAPEIFQTALEIEKG